MSANVYNILVTSYVDREGVVRIHSTRDLGAIVRARRREMGLSQSGLAVRAGVSRPWVSYLEGGKPTIELGRVLRVLEVLDLDLRIHAGAEPSDDAPPVDLDALLDDYRSDG